MIHEHQLEVSIKAPYFTMNELTEETERVWLIFHGYGQLAMYFLKRFEVLDSKKNFIIAPQGLSKFYTEGVTGRVGASWMTKEDRLTEIDNQYAYITSVLRQIGDISSKKLIYFGFSQGTATMGRLAAAAKLPFDKMIIWAGTFPPDVDPKMYNYLTGKEEIHYFTSKNDPYFRDHMIADQNETVKRTTGKEPILHWYDGGHKVIADLLLTI